MAPTAEFAHVSQFYETMLFIGFLGVCTMQGIAVWKKLYSGIAKQISIEDEEYQKWKDEGNKYATSDQAPSVEQINNNKGISEKVEEEGRPKIQEANGMSQLPKRDPNAEDDLTPEQKSYFRLFLWVREFFDQFLPIIACVIVTGILTASTEVFSLAMFFCYIFSGVLFNYLKIGNKLKKEVAAEETKPYFQIISGVFIVALFISYFVRIQHRTA